MPEKKIWITKRPYQLILLPILFCLTLFALFCRPAPAVQMNGTTPESTAPSYEETPAMDLNQKDPKKAILALADARFQQGAFREALGYARQMVSMDPGNIPAHSILGTIYAFTGQKDRARKELDFLEKAKQKGFYPELAEAMLHAQEGKFKEAEGHLGSALEQEPDHPVALYYQGSLDLAQGRLSRAEKSFKTVLALRPDFTPALAGMGQVSLRRKKMKEAAGFYRKAVENDPENLMYRRQLLGIYQSTGQKEAANKEIRKMLYYTPGVKQDFLKRGMLLLTEGSYQEAIKLSDKLIGVYKDVPEAFYIKAAAQINLERKDAALKNLQTYLYKRRGSPLAHHYAGMCYLALGMYDKAEQQFKRAIFINPDMGKSFVPLTIIEQLRGNHATALGGLRLASSGGEPPPLVDYLSAHILLAKGDKPRYLEKMKGAAGLMPGLKKDAVFHVPQAKNRDCFARERNLMVLFFFNGWYGKTIQISDTLIKSYRRDRFAWYFRALAESAQRKVKEAVRSFNSLIGIDPHIFAGHMGLGRLYLKTGELGNAITNFNDAIKIDPQYAPAYVALGDAYMRKKGEQKAVQSYKKAIGIDPESPVVRMKLAMILSGKKESLDEALELAMKARELAPKSPYAMDVLGWIHYKRDELKKALPELEGASQLLPREPHILYHLGLAYYRAGDEEKARKALQAVVRLSPNSEGAKEARRILKKISK